MKLETINMNISDRLFRKIEIDHSLSGVVRHGSNMFWHPVSVHDSIRELMFDIFEGIELNLMGRGWERFI